MGELFRTGGFGMYPTALFGVLMIVAAAFYARRPERRLVPLQLVLGLTTLFAGSLGVVVGVIKSLQSLSGVPAGDRFIWLIGLAESLHNLALALGLILLATMVAAVGALRVALPRASHA